MGWVSGAGNTSFCMLFEGSWKTPRSEHWVLGLGGLRGKPTPEKVGNWVGV